MKYLSNINLTQNELQNAVIQNLATDPTGSKEGQIYYNTATDKLRVFDGTSWADVSASMSGAEIVTAINGSAGVIDLDNLAATVGTAVTNSHTHSNKAALDNVSGTKPIVTYTHSGNKEVVASSFDVDTDTFTSVGHGLVNGNIINPIINADQGNVYPALYYPAGLGFVVNYYVVNAATGVRGGLCRGDRKSALGS